MYFSSLTGGIRGAEGRFEMDYWGLSYKQALEELLRRDSRDSIRVAFENDPGPLNAAVLPSSLQRRLRVVKRREDADYFLTNHRWRYGEDHPGEVFSIAVDEVRILTAYDAQRYR
jgi:hypothetical protein